MIIRNIQHDLFEEGNRKRLVYFGALDSEAEEYHKGVIEKVEVSDLNERAKLLLVSKGIDRLQREITELKGILYEEVDSGAKALKDLVITDIDGEAGGRYEYDETDHGLFISKEVNNFMEHVVPDNGKGNDLASHIDKYKKAFGKLTEISFTNPVDEWEVAGETPPSIPEVGMESLMNIIDPSTLYPKSEPLTKLYNQNGVQIQVAVNTDQAYTMRKAPVRMLNVTSNPKQYLIPIRYGGQDLYVNSDEIVFNKVKRNGSVLAPTSVGSEFVYSIPESPGLTLNFGKDITVVGAFGELADYMEFTQAYEKARSGGDPVPKHGAAVKEALGSVALKSDETRAIMETYKKDGAVTNPPKHAKAKALLIWELDAEKKIAEEFVGGEQLTDELMPIYLDIKSGRTKQVILDGIVNILTGFRGAIDGGDEFAVGQVLEPILEAIKTNITAKTQELVDIKGEELMVDGTDALQEKVESLFSADSKSFEETAALSTKGGSDGVLILSLEDKLYFISRTATQLDKEIKATYGNINDDIKKQRDKIGGFGEDPIGKDLKKKYIKEQCDAAGLVNSGAALKAAFVKLETVIGVSPSKAVGTPSEVMENLTDSEHEPLLALLRPETKKKIERLKEVYEKAKTDPKAAGGGILTITTEGGAKIEAQAPADLYKTLAKHVTNPATKAGLTLAASTSSAKKVVSTKTSAKHIEAASLGIKRDIFGRPKARSTAGLPEAEKEKIIKEDQIELRKWKLETRVFKGNGKGAMADVFKKTDMALLNDFYDKVNGMKESVPGSGRIDKKDDWRLLFKNIIKDAGKKQLALHDRDIHLMGRPLILFNMIRRAKNISKSLGIMDHSGTGDTFLLHMAKKRWEQDNEGKDATDLSKSPEVDPAHSKKIEGLNGLMVDIAGMEAGDERGYKIYANPSSAEFPLVIRVVRTHQGYDVHYGSGEGHFDKTDDLNSTFKHNILATILRARDGGMVHSYRIPAEGLSDMKMKEYFTEYDKQTSVESAESDIYGRREHIIKDIARASKLPVGRLKVLLQLPHTELLAKVGVVQRGDFKVGKAPLKPKEYKAALLYLEAVKPNDIKKNSPLTADAHLYTLAKKQVKDHDHEAAAKPKGKGGKLKGGPKKAAAYRPSVIARFENLGIRGAMARRGKQIYFKMLREWTSGAGLSYKDQDWNRSLPSSQYDRMDANLKPGFEGMLKRTEGRVIPSINHAYHMKRADKAIITNHTTVEDSILRMASMAVRAEHIGKKTAVDYIIHGGVYEKSRDRGSSYRRTRRGATKRYT